MPPFTQAICLYLRRYYRELGLLPGSAGQRRTRDTVDTLVAIICFFTRRLGAKEVEVMEVKALEVQAWQRPAASVDG